MAKPTNTPDEIFVEIRQIRSDCHTCAIVILEGTTDRAFWTKYRTRRCELIPADNKDKAVSAIREVNGNSQWMGIAAVVDPDTWLFDDSTHLRTTNLLFDDTPDIELMLFMSQALEDSLQNSLHDCTTNEVRTFAEAIRSHSVRLATDYGYFRLLHRRRSRYSLMVGGVGKTLEQYIDLKTMELNNEKIAAEIVEPLQRVSAGKVLELVGRLKTYTDPTLDLCRGKDTLLVMAHILPEIYDRFFDCDRNLRRLRKLFQIENGNHEIGMILRMNYDSSYFPTTELFKRIRRWECDNSDFRILRDFAAQTA